VNPDSPSTIGRDSRSASGDRAGARPQARRCTRNLAHIPAYADTPMQCTQSATHNQPHTYDPADTGNNNQ
jgi:hypothetical protein